MEPPFKVWSPEWLNFAADHIAKDKDMGRSTSSRRWIKYRIS